MASYKGSAYVSAVIPVPLEDVWARVRAFADLSWSGIEGVHWQEEGYQQKDNVLGKHRVIPLGDKVVVEVLTGHSDAEHYYTYNIVTVDEGVFPGKLANYKARLSFKRVTETNSAFVEWSATYDVEESSAAAVQQVLEQGIFLGSLQKLRQALAPTSA